MPAILDGEEEVRKWLDYGEVHSPDALKLLQSKNILTFHPVSSVVNNSRNNFPKCIEPLDLNSKKVFDLLWYFAYCDWENVLNMFQLRILTNDPQEPKSTAGSKMMVGWLKSSTPSKRKEPNPCESKERESKAETRHKAPGALQQWLQGSNKKRRTN